MIEVLNAPDHVAAFRISGTVTAEDYDTVIETVEAKLGAHESIGMMVDAAGLEDMTAEAIGKRVRYGLSRLGDLHRFKRAGIVSDKQWIAALAGYADRLLPRTEARAFPPGESNAALDWVAAAPAG